VRLCVDLPEGQVDLVLCAMDNHADSSKPTANVRANIAAWLGRNRAIVMAIDPPATGPSVAAAKCSLSLALPLALGERCGQVLLCDVALPRCVYRELGIQYSSPFAHKFVIPLHSRH
jgi:enhancer of mRNA-decapping protein 3